VRFFRSLLPSFFVVLLFSLTRPKAKRLSQVASTAAFDKHPQSQERGMTLDLGFSAFFASVPKHWAPSAVTELQFTL